MCKTGTELMNILIKFACDTDRISRCQGARTEVVSINGPREERLNVSLTYLKNDFPQV